MDAESSHWDDTKQTFNLQYLCVRMSLRFVTSWKILLFCGGPLPSILLNLQKVIFIASRHRVTTAFAGYYLYCSLLGSLCWVLLGVTGFLCCCNADQIEAGHSSVRRECGVCQSSLCQGLPVVKQHSSIELYIFPFHSQGSLVLQGQKGLQDNRIQTINSAREEKATGLCLVLISGRIHARKWTEFLLICTVHSSNHAINIDVILHWSHNACRTWQ